MTDQQPDSPRDPMAVSTTSELLGAEPLVTVTADGKIVVPAASLAVVRKR